MRGRLGLGRFPNPGALEERSRHWPAVLRGPRGHRLHVDRRRRSLRDAALHVAFRGDELHLARHREFRSRGFVLAQPRRRGECRAVSSARFDPAANRRGSPWAEGLRAALSGRSRGSQPPLVRAVPRVRRPGRHRRHGAPVRPLEKLTLHRARLSQPRSPLPVSAGAELPPEKLSALSLGELGVRYRQRRDLPWPAHGGSAARSDRGRAWAQHDSAAGRRHRVRASLHAVALDPLLRAQSWRQQKHAVLPRHHLAPDQRSSSVPGTAVRLASLRA